MAGYKGHMASGLVLSGVYIVAVSFLPIATLAEKTDLLNNWQASAAIMVITMLFSLFPDVDTNSKAQDIFFSFALVIDILLIITDNLQASAYLGLIAMLPILGHHRGWTHKKWAALVVPLPIILIPYLYSSANLPISVVYYGAATVGYLSHLILDGRIVFKKSRQ